MITQERNVQRKSFVFVDSQTGIATTDQNIPYVRTVNAYYEDG